MRYTLILVVCVAISLCSGQVEDETDVNAEQDNAYIEGDILLSPSQQNLFMLMRSQKQSTNPLDGIQNAVIVDLPDYAWTDGIVPYVIDTDHAATIEVVQQAINDYHSMTCIQFVERTNELDYIRIFKGSGCYSYIGRIGGPQDVSIGFGCESKGIVIHEFFHALGRWHEQSRPDRDQFVTINLDNVRGGTEGNFERLDEVFYISTQGVPYDFGSVMHYGAYAFAVDRRVPTIRPIDSTIPLGSLGQRNGFSDRDITHIENQYCGGVGGSWGSWTAFSACSRTCNGGERVRTRECIGGTSCSGSSIQREVCSTNSCPVQPSWSSWNQWSGCSHSCGTGQRTRTRQCQNGNTCAGSPTQVQSCNTQSCPIPSSWGPWGSWSSCSRTCAGGGVRSRQRTCQNGNDCQPGTHTDQQSCNEGVVCPVNPNSGEWGEWSSCSVTCGGGNRVRTRLCGALQCNSESESCNEKTCEDRLQGLIHIGCYPLPITSRLKVLDGTDRELLDHPFTRVEPIRKCGSAALRAGYQAYGVILGYCLSGSSNMEDYVTDDKSNLYCNQGIGGYASSTLYMDAYQIFSSSNFQDSVEAIVNGTEPDNLDDASSGAIYIPSLTLFLVLLVISLSLL